MTKTFSNSALILNSCFARLRLLILVLAINSTIFPSCRKLVEIPQPINSITDEAVYSTDASAASVLTGMYVSMAQATDGGFTGIGSFLISASLSADELSLRPGSGGSLGFFFQNNLINGSVSPIWSTLYNYIYRCNAVIEGITASKTLTESIKKQLLGEAYFLRSFYYFHLVNLFGPVPLTTTTDYTKNTLLFRASVEDVYKLVVADLEHSRNLLSESFLNGSASAPLSDRVRPTKWAATALLARVYLYVGDYSNAAIQASAIINNRELFSLSALNNVFLKNNSEAIWQLQPVDAFFNTWDARVFIIPSAGFDVDHVFYVNPSLVSNLEPGDQRFVPGNWMDSINIDDIRYYYPFKYKANTYNPDIIPENGLQFSTEYQMVLRLGEQYLVRAEALAHLGDLAGAIKDIDSIRNRAGLPLIAGANPGIAQEDLLEVIFRERRAELFTEWCHRWFDLKRTGKVDEIMSIETSLKGGSWESWKALFPVPLGELQKAPNLTQNPGYPD